MLRSAVIDAALTLDADLIKAVLQDPRLKEQFFIEVDGVLVFDQTKFSWVVDSKEFLNCSGFDGGSSLARLERMGYGFEVRFIDEGTRCQAVSGAAS